MVSTPKGTIPAEKLVRAFKRARTVHPNGTIMFRSAPVQAVLAPYAEQLANSWGPDAQPEWIQFRKVVRRLLDAFMTAVICPDLINNHANHRQSASHS